MSGSIFSTMTDAALDTLLAALLAALGGLALGVVL